MLSGHSRPQARQQYVSVFLECPKCIFKNFKKHIFANILPKI